MTDSLSLPTKTSLSHSASTNASISSFSPLQIHDSVGVCGVRTDTRLLAEIAADAPKPGRALDMGTGTGYIGLYLAQRGWQVDAVDVSPRAVELARANAQRNALTINIYQSNLFDQTTDQYDVIAFNPPMRPDENELSRIVTSLLRRSPAISRLLMQLVGERFETGRTEFLTLVVEEARQRLRPDGRLVLGISDDEAQEIARIPHVTLLNVKDIPGMARQEIATFSFTERL